MKVYNVICPKCGEAFQIVKGATILEHRSGEKLSDSRKESEPEYCPRCNFRMSVNDSEFHKYVKDLMMID